MRQPGIQQETSDSFKRDLTELPRIAVFMGRHMEDQAVDRGTSLALDLAVEELFTNMIKYNPDGSPEISVAVRSDETAVTVVLVETDSPVFDPTKSPLPDVTAALGERQPGGLGIHLVARMMDEVRYEHHDRTSTITLVKKLAASHA